MSAKRAQRRAAPEHVLSLVEGPARIALAVGPMHSSDEGR